MEKKKKWIRYGVLAIAILGLLILDMKAIMNIHGKQNEGYTVQTGDLYEVGMQPGETQVTFKALSEQMTHLNLWVATSEDTTGQLSWSVQDDAGQVLLTQKNQDLKALRSEDGDRITIEIAGPGYQVGETYRVHLLLDLDQEVRVTLDAQGVMHSQNYPVTYRGILYGILFVINLILAAFFILFLRFGWNDKLFLAVTVFTGLAAVFLTPPYAREDEFRHFLRAYDLANGNIGYFAEPPTDVVGNVMPGEDGKTPLIEVPAELSELRLTDYYGNQTLHNYFSEINERLCLTKLMSILRNPEQEGTVVAAETATVGRGWESYWPQAIMIKLGQGLGVRSAWLYYLACLGQMLVSSLCMWLAFVLVRKSRVLISLCSLVPVITLYRSSCNPDGYMIGLILLAIGVFLHLREQKIPILSVKGLFWTVVYLLLAYMVMRIKVPYTLFVLGFILLLKKENMPHLTALLQKRNGKIAVAVAGSVGVLLILYVLFLWNGGMFWIILDAFVSTDHQIYFLEHPKTVIVMFLKCGWNLVKQTVTCLKGDYFLPYWLIVGVALVFSKKQFGVISRCYQIFLFLVMLGFIALAGYVMTPLDSPYIWGVTYRYVLPFVPAVALALPSGTEKTERVVLEWYPILLIAAVGASCLVWAVL